MYELWRAREDWVTFLLRSVLSGLRLQGFVLCPFESFPPAPRQRLIIGKSLLKSNLDPYCYSFLLAKTFELLLRNMKTEPLYNASENCQLSES